MICRTSRHGTGPALGELGETRVGTVERLASALSVRSKRQLRRSSKPERYILTAVSLQAPHFPPAVTLVWMTSLLSAQSLPLEPCSADG